MTASALTNCRVVVGSSDLSDHVYRLLVQTTYNEKDVTPMLSSFTVRQPGLGQGRITLGLLQDFGSGKVDAILRPLLSSSTPVTVKVRPVNIAVSATNPEFSVEGQLTRYLFLGGAVGDVATIEAEFLGSIPVGGGAYYGLGAYGEGSYGGAP